MTLGGGTDPAGGCTMAVIAAHIESRGGGGGGRVIGAAVPRRSVAGVRFLNPTQLWKKYISIQLSLHDRNQNHAVGKIILVSTGSAVPVAAPEASPGLTRHY